MLLIRKIDLSKRFPCPIHCKVFGVDRDVILLENQKRKKIYTCESLFEEIFYDNAFCGLIFFTDHLSEKNIEKKIKKIANRKIKRLRSL